MATMNQVRKAMHAQPFDPFLIRLVDGRTFRVPHPDFVAAANTREMDFVGDDEGIHHIELPLALTVEIPPPAAREAAEGRGERSLSAIAALRELGTTTHPGAPQLD
jgi:hypothetical protein